MRIIYFLLYWVGLIQYRLFKSTNKYSYLAFRKLHGITNGQINDNLSARISKRSENYKFPPITDGINGEMNENSLVDIVGNIEENGFHIFKEKLPKNICDEILSYSLEVPAELVVENGKQSNLKFDPNNPIAPVYKFKEEVLLKKQVLRNVFFDVNLIRIAQRYLNCKPLNNSLLMWWSSLYRSEASSRAAQLFHFDMDHPKFIKFFIYITDVDSSSGPHCFVKGSHRNKPKYLAKDIRYSDEEVQKYYADADIMEICGSAGTIVAVDTSGIHKGKLPETKERLIIQIEFTNSFFGQKVRKLNKFNIPNTANKSFFNSYAEIFARVKK